MAERHVLEALDHAQQALRLLCHAEQAPRVAGVVEGRRARAGAHGQLLDPKHVDQELRELERACGQVGRGGLFGVTGEERG